MKLNWLTLDFSEFDLVEKLPLGIGGSYAVGILRPNREDTLASISRLQATWSRIYFCLDWFVQARP